jgi:hypothetical protein
MSETARSMYMDDMADRRAATGNVVLSVTAHDPKIHETIAALEAHNPVDIDEGSEELSQTGGGMAPPVGLGAGDPAPHQRFGERHPLLRDPTKGERRNTQ